LQISLSPYCRFHDDVDEDEGLRRLMKRMGVDLRTGLPHVLREKNEERDDEERFKKTRKGNSAEAELSYLSQALCADLHGAHALDTRRRFASRASSLSISCAYAPWRPFALAWLACCRVVK
jgi:hypothetical protein